MNPNSIKTKTNQEKKLNIPQKYLRFLYSNTMKNRQLSLIKIFKSPIALIRETLPKFYTIKNGLSELKFFCPDVKNKSLAYEIIGKMEEFRGTMNLNNNQTKDIDVNTLFYCLELQNISFEDRFDKNKIQTFTKTDYLQTKKTKDLSTVPDPCDCLIWIKTKLSVPIPNRKNNKMGTIKEEKEAERSRSLSEGYAHSEKTMSDIESTRQQTLECNTPITQKDMVICPSFDEIKNFVIHPPFHLKKYHQSSKVKHKSKKHNSPVEDKELGLSHLVQKFEEKRIKFMNKFKIDEEQLEHQLSIRDDQGTKRLTRSLKITRKARNMSDRRMNYYQQVERNKNRTERKTFSIKKQSPSCRPRDVRYNNRSLMLSNGRKEAGEYSNSVVYKLSEKRSKSERRRKKLTKKVNRKNSNNRRLFISLERNKNHLVNGYPCSSLFEGKESQQHSAFHKRRISPKKAQNNIKHTYNQTDFITVHNQSGPGQRNSQFSIQLSDLENSQLFLDPSIVRRRNLYFDEYNETSRLRGICRNQNMFISKKRKKVRVRRRNERSRDTKERRNRRTDFS